MRLKGGRFVGISHRNLDQCHGVQGTKTLLRALEKNSQRRRYAHELSRLDGISVGKDVRKAIRGERECHEQRHRDRSMFREC